ncbi:MAG TPA: hypothetical protein VFT22_40745 [Kofleriaceae bacterium]|nr:hypothetical protein [Kofleriaceae bacterium]
MRSLVSTLLFSSSLLVTAACMNRGDSPSGTEDTAESAIDSADSASAEGDVMMSAVDASDGATVDITVDAAVARITANLTARYQPSGCVTITPGAPGPATLQAAFHDCTGPRGLLHVSGELDLAISVSTAGAVIVHGTSNDLHVNGASLDIDATGTYATNGTSHSLTVTTSGTGTGPRGLAVDHEGSYTLTWDPTSQCRTLDGSWSTELGLRTRSNTVDISRCAGGCPTGSIAHTFFGGNTLTVTFDGSATATWTVSTGASGTVALDCR